MSACLFCNIIAETISCSKVYDDNNYYAFNDINPKAPTHFLVVPKKHIAKVEEMSTDDNDLVGGLFSTAAKICEEMNLKDYRLINNGAGVGQTVFLIQLLVIAGHPMQWPPG